ncbi:GNAT family N-acetyltransferase [Algoriphagus sp. AGSA1]|uniref:GNAT family N-acetyltransferase n=1 Tax=Algoriphagus sp. AGSA1 TaxID=2907213 RepID=UPI001F33BB39|nr:GNAT family N-acetyltransferase [Algoriphagus sp. AGSA1]MCE7057314.1 GNAT family N-acetyltransferase [Algoriphagus sp. AGSA1]
MTRLESFGQEDFATLISWIHSRELLVTIAGDAFSFPLTEDQLKSYLKDENSRSFKVVDASSNATIGHAEILLSGDDMYKIDKFIIGEVSNRGKGIGQQVIRELLAYCFTILNAKVVELNVFDWNIGGIRCYEKCGFKLNPDKKSTFRVDDGIWATLNMTFGEAEWVNHKWPETEAI